MSRLFCFGFGYCARALARRLKARGWSVAGTARSDDALEEMRNLGVEAWQFDGTAPLPASALEGASHILTSVPPDAAGDPVLRQEAATLARLAPGIAWVGYLSTTGVYGDRGGGWVDETASLLPTTERGHRRIAAEEAWLDLQVSCGLPVHIFRLAGIYGPGRNQLDSVRDGTARRIVKEGQVFSRIHVEDVAGVLEASIERPDPGAAYNVCDDEPAPPQEVVAFAAGLLGLPVPPEVPFDQAQLSPMAASFFAESKRVSNERIKQDLGYRLAYPTYREGLRSLL